MAVPAHVRHGGGAQSPPRTAPQAAGALLRRRHQPRSVFGEEQARTTTEIENLEHESSTAAAEQTRANDLAARFDQLLSLLDQLDLDDLWSHATDAERRTLLNELVEAVTVHPDRLTPTLRGAPPIGVAFSEVGLRDSEFSRVGGGT